MIESWQKHDNNVRPHSSPGYHPPAPEVVLWPAKPALAPKPIMHQHSTPTTPWGRPRVQVAENRRHGYLRLNALLRREGRVPNRKPVL